MLVLKNDNNEMRTGAYDRILRFRLLSGFVGLLIPSMTFALFNIVWYCLVKNWVPMGIGWLVLPAVIFMEAPAVLIGRALSLPIETGAAAFFMYELSLLGYLWVHLLWLSAGLAVGWIFEKPLGYNDFGIT